jgi:hypothetical protein
MNSRGRGSDGQDDVDAAFAQIVADLEREGFGSEPSADAGVEYSTGQDQAKPSPEPPASTGKATEEPRRPEVWRPPQTEWDWTFGSDTEHYVPPEPPPMPRLRPGTIAAIGMLLLGALLLIVPSLLGIPARIAIPIALVSLATGVGLLVLRMRSGPPPDTGWDDGAQI